MIEYPNIEAFYSEDERRRRSPEADYGVHWIEEAGRRFPTWTVSYVRATGEVYAVEGNSGRVKVLGGYRPDDEEIYYRSLDKVLKGWSEIGGKPLSWVVERLEGNPRRD